MPFKDSEFADYVVQAECISEDECDGIRRATNRKKQVRSAIILVTSRSFDKMKSFLDGAKKHCPDIVENIWKQYQENLSQNQMSKPFCTLCQMKRCVDVQYVMDDLWSNGIIDVATFGEINACAEVTGQQDKYWKVIIESCNSKKALSALCNALETKGFYTYIAKGLRHQFGQNRQIRCICFSSIKHQGKARTSTFNSDTTEYPNSSHSDDQSSENELGDGSDNEVEHLNDDKEFQDQTTSRPISINTFDPPKTNVKIQRPKTTPFFKRFKNVFVCGAQSIKEEEEDGEED